MAEEFKAQDAYQQNTLSRREIMEKSHNAALEMAERLGQEGQYHAPGAARAQHAALPLPKTGQEPQEIKIFLAGVRTQPSYPPKLQEASSQETPVDEVTVAETEDEEQEEEITDILRRKLAYLYLPFQPPEPVEGPADTLFVVSKSKDGPGANGRALVRAHSSVLKRYNDAFNELIGYRPPVVSDDEDERFVVERDFPIKLRTVPNPERRTSDWWTNPSPNLSSHAYQSMNESNREGADGHTSQELGDFQNDSCDGTTLKTEQVQGELQGEAQIVKSPDGRQKSFVHFDEPQIVHHRRPSGDLGVLEKFARRPSQAFMEDGLMDLGLEHVIGNLQDSQKPLLVKEFLDASENLLKFPGWEHLPPEVKESYQKFAESVGNFRNPGVHAAVKALDQEYNTLGGGGGLESNFLGMVGRRQSTALAGILNNITQGLEDRKRSAAMLAELKNGEQIGKNVSATVARSALERRKSAAYVASQEMRKSISASEPRKSIALIAIQDKRVTPSFLERRQSKALMEIAQREKDKLEAEDLLMRRRTSKAAMVAFERRKRISVLEKKVTKS